MSGSPRVTRVWIEEGCIVCRACEVQCAEVFDVRDDGARVRRRRFAGLEDRIKQAAADCPVKVIEFTTAEPPRRPPPRRSARRR